MSGTNIPIALVSGSTRAQIDIVLKSLGLTGMFKVIVSFEDVGDRSKPDPYGYELALERLNEMRKAAALIDSAPSIEPLEVIVLEDATSGIKAALAAGMKVIGVKNAGVQDISEATGYVETLEDLAEQPIESWVTLKIMD